MEFDIRICTRPKQPAMEIGTRRRFMGRLWELVKIEGDRYHWAVVEDKTDRQEVA